MRRKGISPLIAAVLLIAFTMAVASLFAQWAPQLIKDAQGDTSNQTQEIQRCSGLTFEFVEDQTNESVAVIQQESGDDAIGNVSVRWFMVNGSIFTGYGNIDSKRGVSTVYSNGTDDFPSERKLDEIVATPRNCEGSQQVTYQP